MSKRKTKNRRRSFPNVPPAYEAKTASAPKVGGSIDEHPQPKHRDGIEQLIIAIILAVLFRSFEAEAFIIPTGSMAPTLQGKHKDVKCPECKYRYRTGVADHVPTNLHCPSCNYSFDSFAQSEAPTFNGDRILVNKFAYQFGDPKRWDVIVFKNPMNAKQNYIKRLVGLPNERIRIRHGDVFSAPGDSGDFEILRKPAHKVRAMLQLVHDTDYIPPDIASSGWPTRWYEPVAAGNSAWQISDDRSTYTLAATDTTRWLNYRHVNPSDADWNDIKRGKVDVSNAAPSLITDHYAYNTARGRQVYSGWHWVGDLAVETDLKVNSDSGALTLALVEGGHEFTAQFDVASGEVVVAIDGGNPGFIGGDTTRRAQTRVKGAGRYKIMFANVDERLLLWVNGKPVTLVEDGDGETDACYSLDTSMPQHTESDPGDLNPVRLGGHGIDIEVRRLRVLRDIYYIACKSQGSHPMSQMNIDYRVSRGALDRGFAVRTSEELQALGERRRLSIREEVAELMRTPELWDKTSWLKSRATVEFRMRDEQYFPMGDNAPRSQDARLWAGEKRRVLLAGQHKHFPDDYPADRRKIGHFVPRAQLIGKAFLIYWPHGWPVVGGQLPIIPNVQRMGRIR